LMLLKSTTQLPTLFQGNRIFDIRAGKEKQHGYPLYLHLIQNKNQIYTQ
jgi:hypothetical protein